MPSEIAWIGLALGAASLGALLYLILRRGKKDENDNAGSMGVMEYNIERDDEGRISRIEKLLHDPSTTTTQPVHKQTQAAEV